MPLTRRGWFVAIALALTETASVSAQPVARVVRLEVFPTKDAKPVAVSVRENETLITTIKELGTLAFEVRFRDKQEKVVLVVIFDAETKPNVPLGAVALPVDDKRLDTSTTPGLSTAIARSLQPPPSQPLSPAPRYVRCTPRPQSHRSSIDEQRDLEV